MDKLSNLEQKIRKHVNDKELCGKYFEDKEDEWNALCVAMDTLGDTCLALEYYETYGFGDKEGEIYLKLYGTLQAIFLQQDSISKLYKIFINEDLQKGSEWIEIRKIRNLAVGHPVEKKDNSKISRCFISRGTIEEDGFLCIVCSKNKKDEYKDIDLKKIYNSYKSEAIQHLEIIYKNQVDKWDGLTFRAGQSI